MNECVSEQVRDLPKNNQDDGPAFPNPFQYNEKGEPLCVHDNKVIVITFDSMTLGDDTAQCPYKKMRETFNPIYLPSDQMICRTICKVARQNLNVEKIGVEKAKINARFAAKFQYDMQFMGLKQNPGEYLSAGPQGKALKSNSNPRPPMNAGIPESILENWYTRKENIYYCEMEGCGIYRTTKQDIENHLRHDHMARLQSALAEWNSGINFK